MSTVRDRGVIDMAFEEGGRHILVISDDLEWSYSLREQHGQALQDKINDYLIYIFDGRADRLRPGLRCVIRIVGKYAFSHNCLAFLERVKAHVKSHGDICDVEWTHMPDEGPFEDGFSDDFVFDGDKVFLRLRKNWAKRPLEKVELLAPEGGQGDMSTVPMFRWMDSFVYFFVQDTGSTLQYLAGDMLPDGVTPEELQKRAFDNLSRQITYRWEETKEPGVFGILAGGNFEAESLLFTGIWRTQAERLGDDLLICAPTRDMVLFTGAGDKKLCRRMLKMAGKIFRDNGSTPHMLLCRDVFLYDRAEDALSIHPRLTL